MRRIISLLFIFCIFVAGVGIKPAFAHHCHFCEKDQKVVFCSQCEIGQYCGKACQKKDWKKHKSVCKELKSLVRLQGRAEIKPSDLPGAGLGLFAVRDLGVGEEIAAYAGTLIPDEFSLEAFSHFRSFYLLSTPAELSIDGFHENVPAYLAAAVANDGNASLEFVEKIMTVDYRDLKGEKALLKKLIRQYLSRQLSREGHNVKIVNPSDGHFPIYTASKKIKKGQEILSSYELTYWAEIALSIAKRKSLLREALELQGIFSEAVEDFVNEKKLPKTYTKAIFGLYMDKATQKKDEKIMFSDWATGVRLRVASLITVTNTLQVELPAVDLLAVEHFLDELAQRPNSEFYQVDRGGIIHPESLTWIRKMAAENKIVFFDVAKNRSYRWADLEPQATLDKSGDLKSL